MRASASKSLGAMWATRWRERRWMGGSRRHEYRASRNRTLVGGRTMSSGWAESAAAWIADMGDEGDYGRACVLDRPIMDRVRGREFGVALDVGCGEGRFCRNCFCESLRLQLIRELPGLVEIDARPEPERMGNRLRRGM